MTAYINRLIIVMVVCQIVTVLTPDTDTAKRSIRTVCALVALLTLLSPLTQLLTSADDLIDKVTAFFSSTSTPAYDEKEMVSSEILHYVTARYEIEELSMTLVTDETDTVVTEIRFYIPNCPYATRASLASELTEIFELPVYVFSE